MSKEQLIISKDRCKACGYCIEVCPKKALKFSSYTNSKGYSAVEVDADLCITCAQCYRVCPDYVFEIK